jgi:CDP-paratose 2-epimerase
LIGSEAVKFFHELGFDVTGVDNDMRRYFFGEEASTKQTVERLKAGLRRFRQLDCDIRDEKKMEEVFRQGAFELIVHTAAQPSHDWAAREPITDFTVNANGTLVLLECYRRFSPEAVFIYTSTNKAYGDRTFLLYLDNAASHLGTRTHVRRRPLRSPDRRATHAEVASRR